MAEQLLPLSRHAAPAASLRMAVIGAGYFGRIHATKCAALAGCDLIAVVDSNLARAEALARSHNAVALSDHRALPGMVEAVCIATPIASHYEIAAACLEAGLHVLVEKPMAATLAEADRLIARAAARGRVLQIGHQERFFTARHRLSRHIRTPARIACVRRGPYRGRGGDSSVVMDLMIHDLSLVRSLVRAPLVEARATGRRLLTDHADTVEASLRFADGSLAHLVASRAGEARERVSRIESTAGRVEIDFVARRCTIEDGSVLAPSLPPPAWRPAGINGHEFLHDDDLAQGLAAFLAAIRGETTPMADGRHGRQALAAALAVEAALMVAPQTAAQS
jgi:predicted dehydrogenase